MGFGGDYGVYHSAYDSFYWMAHFGDPTFQYHVAAAQIWGTVALRLADAGGLPLDYTDYASQLREFVNETKTLALRRKLGDSYDAKALLAAVDDFAEEAAKIDKRRHAEVSEFDKGSSGAALARLRKINDALIRTERALIDDRGLRGRTWFRHQIYAPGFYTGYAALPLPDLRQAIEDGRAADANEAAERITAAIKRATEVLKQGRS
jgi:N-acetylated-alpha-linked acidic dipeptidase